MVVLSLPGIADEDALERAISVKRSLASMEAEQFLYVLEFLDECAADPDVRRVCGRERIHLYGGDGTPEIPEFAVCEIAAALGMANRSASALVADILDLRHRLPLLFRCLRDGDVETWRVRRVASASRELSLATVAKVDERLARAGADGTPVVARMSRSRVEKVIDQFACRDDADEVEDEAKANLENRWLGMRPAGPGVEEISGTVATGPGRRMWARIEEIAGWLGELDAAAEQPRRSIDVRRSIAMTMLGDAEQLTSLADRIAVLRGTSEPDEGECAGDEPESDESATDAGDEADANAADGAAENVRGSRRGRTGLSATVLYVHLDRASGSWSLDGRGPLSRAEAMDLVGHSRVTVKPVIDLAQNISYTGYVAPPRLKEQTALANHGFCTFPHCGNSAWLGEYDHIVDYHARGPTDARNGHRLCKHHHRAKTFGGWTVISPTAGVWVWRSPRGRCFHVAEGITTPLDLDLFRYAA